MATESLSEQVARLEARVRSLTIRGDEWKKSSDTYETELRTAERLLAEVTRELDELREGAAEEMRQRDTYRDMWQAAESRLADAERRAAREAADVLIEFVRTWRGFDADVAGPVGPSTGNVLLRHLREFRDREYPAVPPEREGAGLPPHEPDLGRTGNPAQWCERCRIEASRPTPPVEGAQECKVVEYDGAFKCLTHKRKWGAISNPDQPCRPTPPQAAPEPLCDQCLQPLTADESRDHDNPTRHTIRGCNRALGRAMQRIVETARRASGREG